MRKYANKSMAELAADLTAPAAPKRLRKGYVDSAEAMLRIMSPDREYPWEFVMFRLTGFRPQTRPSIEPMSGESLQSDLLALMLDICDSFTLHTKDYDEPASDIASLAKRFHVSTKTIQRWRKRGLPARRLVDTNGKRRLIILDSSVQWFIRDRRRQIRRSMNFSQMSSEERRDIIRRARRLAIVTHCRLSEVVAHLANRSGRAKETIRYTIRKHDADNPSEAVFPYLAAPLQEEQKAIIYRRFLRGVPVPLLAKRYHRTRGSIYRIINEVRAKQLIKRPIPYIPNDEFSQPDSAEEILAVSPPTAPTKKPHRPPQELPPYLRALYTVPLLVPQKERELFRRYNFLKYQADTLRKKIDVNHIRTSHLKRIETLLLRANAVKNQILRANLRLVVSIAKKHLRGPQTLFELISDGNVSLMRAVEKFDYARGFRFSTYASWAIMRNYARSVPKERYQLDHFATGCEEVLDIASALRTYDPNEVNISELRESIDVVLAQLTPTERSILTGHYGLEQGQDIKTLEKLANRLGLSKERVRQIEIRALKKLRRMLAPDKAALLT